jgi:hypothetical protein
MLNSPTYDHDNIEIILWYRLRHNGYQMSAKVHFPGPSLPEREADLSPPISAEVNNACCYTSTDFPWPGRIKINFTRQILVQTAVYKLLSKFVK